MRVRALALASGWALGSVLSGCGGHTDRDSGEPTTHVGDTAGGGGGADAGAAAQGAAGRGGETATVGDAAGGTEASGGSGVGGEPSAAGTGTGGAENVGGTVSTGGATAGGAGGSSGASPGGAGGAAGQGGVTLSGGTAGAAGQGGVALSGGMAGAAGESGAAGEAGAGGAGGASWTDLCQLVSPLPPGCPCTDSAECDGVCLALADDPCEEGVTGICANPPSGGCVCELSESYTGIVCIEREICPETEPEYPQSCTLVSQVCAYDTPAHERCWCMNRFGDPVWECAREDVDCPYSQPTPGSSCTGTLECFFATASSLAYRCTCTSERWNCEMVVG